MSLIADAYNQWSQSYDDVENKTRDLDRSATEQVLSGITWRNVLELGCGTGKNTGWFADRAETVVAVDFSEGMLATAAKKIRTSHVTFKQADVTKPWHFTDTRFDLICCNLMLEHIENIEPVFANAALQLVDNGYFFISELHPFKQYAGSKARFEKGGETIILHCYTHHVSAYFCAAKKAGLSLLDLEEWFDDDNNQIPRLLTLLFQKK